MAKLVRDKIKNIIEQNDQIPVGYIADKKELRQRIADKLIEEAKEFAEDRSAEELADVQEVLEALYSIYGFSKEEIAVIQKKKKEARGGFIKGYILEYVQTKQ